MLGYIGEWSRYVFLVFILSGSAMVSPCPSEICICEWKYGKQTVECNNQQLTAIPDDIDKETQVLNFSDNSLKELKSNLFIDVTLLNLQKISLSRNHLTKIHTNAFRGLDNLVDLDLSENSLENVPTESLHFISLIRLSLSGNPIRELKASEFQKFSSLRRLDLGDCQIELIENNAFIGMDNLEWLRLDGNRIRFIQGTNIFPNSLREIALQRNPWYCDCRLLDLHAWMANYNIPQTEEPECVQPQNMKGRLIKNLQKNELFCFAKISLQSTHTETLEELNITTPRTIKVEQIN